MSESTLSRGFLFFRLFLFLCSINYSIAGLVQNSIGPQEPQITCDSSIEPIVQNKSNSCEVTSCHKFIVTYLILLENPNYQLDNIFDFIKINTRGCNKASFFIINPACANDTSGTSCSSSSLSNLYQRMEDLQLADFLPDRSISMAENLNNLLDCATHTIDNYHDDGSSITLITDISCVEFCNSNLPDKFYQTFKQFANDGYDVRINFTGIESSYTSCADFLEATNIDHTFGSLPLANAQSFCIPPNVPADYCNVTSRKVEFGKPFSNTNTKLIIMGYLLEYWNMDDYKKFLRTVVASCNEDDFLQILSPTLSNGGYENNMTPQNIDDLIGSTTINTFFESDPTIYESGLLSLTDQLYNAAINSTGDYNQYIYIFTDIDCPWFCSMQSERNNYPAAQYFVNTMKDLYNKGFMVRIFHLPKLSASCDSFSFYWDSTGLPVIQPVPTENFNYFLVCRGKITTLSTLVEETTTNKEFVLATDTPGSSEKWKMGLLIGFASLCLLLLGTTVFFVVLSKRRMKSRKLAVHNLKKIIANASGGDEKNDDYWRLPTENLLINELEVLGRGAFGCVYKGKYQGAIPSLDKNAKLKMSLVVGGDGAYEVAIKRLPAYAIDSQRQELVQEIEFMKTLGHHIHVIAMLGYVDHFDDPMILLEYCEQGDLHHHLQQLRNLNSDDSPNSKEFVALAWQIVDGLCYLHAHNFVHRDLAARNILLTRNMVAKISDFGLCRQNDSTHYTSKGGKLPIRWMAIESLKFFEFSTKSDIWSYGVTVWELFSLGESPFQAIQGEELATYLEGGNRLKMPDSCPDCLSDLISQCWSSSPEDRPRADKVRSKIAGLLDESSMYYGYLNFETEEVQPDEYVVVSKRDS